MFSRELEFRVRLFNVLAIAGIVSSIINAASSIVNGGDMVLFDRIEV